MSGEGVSDKLSGIAVWSLLFAILSVTIVGGAIGGLIAGLISIPILKAMPTRDDGRKLPVPVSVLVLIAAVVIFVVGHVVLMEA